MLIGLVTTAAKIVNVLVVASMVGIGVHSYNDVKISNLLRQISDEQALCLQQNVYFEARNQSSLGQRAVAWVTLNRVKHTRYPDTICDVVWQTKQFSWTHDGKPDRPSTGVVEQRAWEKAKTVANKALIRWLQDEEGPVESATMFHADYVTPFWTSSYDRVAQIDAHIFYSSDR